jgi:hypothetical protein
MGLTSLVQCIDGKRTPVVNATPNILRIGPAVITRSAYRPANGLACGRIQKKRAFLISPAPAVRQT